MTRERDVPDLILLNIGFAVHRADWNYKNVNSPFARIFLVNEGCAKLHMAKQTQTLTSGHLYLIPPFTPHSYECDNYFSLHYIHIYENPLSRQRILEEYTLPAAVKATPFQKQLVEQLIRINPGRELREYDPSAYDNSNTLMNNISLHTRSPWHAIMESKGILLQLLSRFFSAAAHKYQTTDNRIQEALRYIQKNTQKAVSIHDLASLCFLSKDHFIRLFRQEMGITPTLYIQQKKMERAQLLLLTTHLSVKDIAYQLAFENVSYFNRLFMRYTQTTPMGYRQKE